MSAMSSVSGLTSEGLVFGTLPYTSPEQLRAEKVDTRTDIFAFGAVLYEMLTGARPFAADSQAALIAAILEHDVPPVSERQPVAAANLEHALAAVYNAVNGLALIHEHLVDEDSPSP